MIPLAKSSDVVQKIVSILVFLVLSASSQITGDIRLTGYGSNSLGGLIEVYLNGSWGAVCGGTTFHKKVASVACRQLGLGPAIDVVYYPDLRYGISENNISIGNLVCTGEESHLLRCHYDVLPPNCSPYQNVGIMCSASSLPYSGSVRILPVQSTPNVISSGLLQLYLEGKWQHVCYDKQTIESANSACRQMGYTSAHKFTESPLKSNAVGTWIFDSAHCMNSPCFSTCTNVSTTNTSTCTNGLMLHCTFDQAKVDTVHSGNQSICEVSRPYVDDVRLTAETNDGKEGIPEVYTASGWLKVCVDQFSLPVGDVLCKQLGHPAAHQFEVTDEYGGGIGVGLDCTGTENNARDCHVSVISDCEKHVQLKCIPDIPPYGSLRLYNGSGSAGSLHLFDGESYVPLCDHNFGENELNVACKQLGYEKGIRTINNTLYGLSVFTTEPYDNSFRCSGDEEYLLKCAMKVSSPNVCRNPYDAVSIQCGVSDSSRIRFVGGNATSGLLQVELNGKWGTVCGLEFSHYDAHVACREMGFKTSSGLAMRGTSSLDAVDVPVHITSFQCSGFESNLLSCPHQVADNGTCQHQQDVYLYCSNEYPIQDGEIRFVDGRSSLNSGRLEISYHGLWMSVCGKLFTKQAADAACRQMDFVYAETYCKDSCNGTGSGDIFFGETRCDGSEMKLIECETEIHNNEICTHQNDVWITCSDKRISHSQSTTTPSSTSVTGTAPEPSTRPVVPDRSPLLPFPDIYLYIMMGGVVIILLVVVILTALVCCACICKKKHRRGSSEQSPELNEGISNNNNESRVITSPRAVNAFFGLTPPQSSDDTCVSMADLKECPQKEIELGYLSGGLQPDVPLELKGLNTATGGAVSCSRETSGVFEEVDFGGLEAPPPRYDELDFEDSCEFDNSSLKDCEPVCDRSLELNGCKAEHEEKALEFTTIRIREL